jgi:very-short-patch-repair endonuclease
MAHGLRPRRKSPTSEIEEGSLQGKLFEPKPFKHARSLRAAATASEFKLWQALRRKQIQGLRFRRQHPSGPYFADFVCLRAKLVVEIDGLTHITAAEVAYDEARTRRLERDGFKVIQFWNLDVLTNIEFVLEQIALQVQRRMLRDGEDGSAHRALSRCTK